MFEKLGNPQIGYAVMLKIRTQLINASFNGLCRALTIGVRYAIQRTQFFDEVEGKKIP